MNGKWPNVNSFNDKYKGTVAKPLSPSMHRKVSSSSSKFSNALPVRFMENAIKNGLAALKQN